MIVESRETTVHQLAIEKEYANLYPDDFKETDYLSYCRRTYNLTYRAKKKEKGKESCN